MIRPSTRVERPGARWPKTLRARQLRRAMTDAEQRLWEELRRHTLGCRVRRQHVVLGWIVDFFVPAARLAIEVDGGVHDERVEDDRLRTEALEAAGLRVIRFRNERVLSQTREVVDDIVTAIRAQGYSPCPAPAPAAAPTLAPAAAPTLAPAAAPTLAPAAAMPTLPPPRCD